MLPTRSPPWSGRSRRTARRRSPACRRCTAARSDTSATTPSVTSRSCRRRRHDDLGFPELWLLFTGSLLVFDHLRQRPDRDLERRRSARIPPRSTTRPWSGPRRSSRDSRARRRGARRSRPRSRPTWATSASNVGREAFVDNVTKVKEHIAAGDIFQVRGVAALRDARPKPTRSTSTGCSGSSIPVPYMFFLNFADLADRRLLAGAARQGRRPRGDRSGRSPAPAPRGATEDEDDKLAAELLADEKERAEHVMLVDLARNDLGRVCTPGTVRVSELMQVERYSHVMHIVSEVHGEIEPELDRVRRASSGRSPPAR